MEETHEQTHVKLDMQSFERACYSLHLGEPEDWLAGSRKMEQHLH